MRSNLILSIIVTLLLVALLLSYHFKERANQTGFDEQTRVKKCQLRYGWGEWRPLHYRNDMGEVVGIQSDFVRAIGRQMDCEIRFLQYSNWQEMLQGIQRGKIDFVSNATATPERSNFAYFSIPYRNDVFAIYVLAANYEQFAQQDFGSLKASGFKLALTENFEYGAAIDEWKNDINFNQSLTFTKTAQDSYHLLLSNQVDGLVDDPFIVFYNLHKLKITEEIKALPIRSFGLPVSYMFSKKTVSSKLVERFNIALNKVLSMPEYQSFWVDFAR